MAMFRPYLAVIIDSFREALASRVLWVVLGLIVLVLMAIAPFGYRERTTVTLNESDVRDWPAFIQRVRDDAKKEEPSAARHFVSLMDDKTRKMTNEFAMPQDGDFDGAMQFVRSLGAVRNEMNRLLELPEFYDKESWKNVPMASEELRPLVDQPVEKLKPTEIGRRNRLLLEAAYTDFVEASPPESFQVRYLGFDILDPLPIRPKQFRDGLESAVAWLIGFLVGIIGVFVAILVTSPIIPQMFDPGQLNLLLSKPVTRSFLFLSKFVGGCAFTLLNASVLVVGLWLILGLRFDSWDPKLLWSIPVYLFMFAIYYTVSALSGLMWRSAIVSIIVTVVFWVVCFTLGLAERSLDSFYISKQRLVQVIDAKDAPLAVNEMGFVFRWDEATNAWTEVFTSDVQKQLRPAMMFMPVIPPEMKSVGPIYDPAGDQLVAIQRSFRTGQVLTYVGPRQDDFKSVKGAGAASGAMYLFREPDDKLLVVSSTGLYRLEGNPLQESKPVKVFGLALPIPSADVYRSVGPEDPLLITRPASVSLNPDSGELAVYTRGKLVLLKKDADGRYQRRLEKPLDEEEMPAMTIAYAGDFVLAGREDGRLTLLRASDGEVVKEFEMERTQPPRFLVGAPGGRHFAALFHDGHLWMVDTDKADVKFASASGQGEISAIAFRDAEHLRVVDRVTRLTEYTVSDMRVAQRWSPKAGLLDASYRYVIHPAYTLFPKPRELGDTVTYLLSGKSAKPVEGAQGRQNLDEAQKQLDPWAPVWSSAAFMIVVLGLGCLYLERQEF